MLEERKTEVLVSEQLRIIRREGKETGEKRVEGRKPQLRE